MTWRKLHPCPDDNTMYAPSSLMEYLITGLDEGSTYNITVIVANAADSISSSPVIATRRMEIITVYPLLASLNTFRVI